MAFSRIIQLSQERCLTSDEEGKLCYFLNNLTMHCKHETYSRFPCNGWGDNNKVLKEAKRRLADALIFVDRMYSGLLTSNGSQTVLWRTNELVKTMCENGSVGGGVCLLCALPHRYKKFLYAKNESDLFERVISSIGILKRHARLVDKLLAELSEGETINKANNGNEDIGATSR